MLPKNTAAGYASQDASLCILPQKHLYYPLKIWKKQSFPRINCKLFSFCFTLHLKSIKVVLWN